MKKNLILSICMLALSVVAFAKPTVDEKLLKSFKETFPKAEQVKWEEFTDNYIVNFVVLGIRERISYDKEGNFINATRYYTEENLPLNIFCKIKKKYPNQKVFGVTEVETEASVEYYVKLDDGSNWTTVKSDSGGNLQVIEKYKKAPEN
ncbi:MAG TPA: hypothetical protein VFV08_11210 [Puia sp.]|nr:hypothetical protein [Puia sp.]